MFEMVRRLVKELDEIVNEEEIGRSHLSSHSYKPYPFDIDFFKPIISVEPTDGFSKEQLFKVRDILTELKCPQIIIVSHERELESFADQIFQLIKSENVSRITLVRRQFNGK